MAGSYRGTTSRKILRAQGLSKVSGLQQVRRDEAFALSVKILDIQDDISYDLEFPKIVHMKSMVQNWPCVSEDWTDHVGFYFNRNSELKIGNFYQDSIVHYVKKNKIDREVLSILEEKAWKN